MTKHRKADSDSVAQAIFTQDGLKVLSEAFAGVAQKMDFNILEFNEESDHVHLLTEKKFS